MAHYSFQEWIQKKIAPSLKGVGLLLLVSQITILGIIFRTSYQRQYEFLSRFEIIGLEAFSEHQPRLLNHFGAIATSEIDAKSLILCGAENEVLWSYPRSVSHCDASSADPTMRVLKSRLFLDRDYPKVVIQVSRFPSSPILWVLFVTTTVIVVGGSRLLLCIRRRIKNDIYFPITQISSPDFQSSIAELHQVNNDLNVLRRKEKEQAALVAIGEMAGGVAHDIRSPLSSLNAVSVLLLPHLKNGKEAAEVMNLLQLSSKRLGDIANDLLQKYKGKGDSGVATFSIHEVLDELIGELHASPLGYGVQFRKQYHSIALYLSGDRIGVARALGNIMKNALEAMQGNREGKIKELVLGTELCLNSSSSLQSDSVCIRIADTGPGIAPDKIPHVLRGGYTEGKLDGHGIGTKIVRDMVDAQKGTLNIESKIGEGSVFILMLPKADIDPLNTATTVAIPYSVGAPIRVIDDEASLREQWRLTLKKLGAETDTYQSWEELDSMIAMPQCNKQDTFIIDYHFDNSEVDGLEIIRRLKALGFTNFVLATAEYWKPAIKDASNKLNVVLCPKPLPEVVLAACHTNLATCYPEPKTQGVSSSLSILLIDDDSAIQAGWNAMKGILGVGKLTMYNKLEEMIAAATNPADYDLCVIDKNIEKSQYKGARTLEYLKLNGARKVLLATGENSQDIAQDPDFSAIDGILAEKIPMSLTQYLT